MQRLLSEMLNSLEVKKITGSTDQCVRGIGYDSRKIRSGHIFCCLAGNKGNGHDYIEHAIEMGALAIVTEKDLEIKKSVKILVPDARFALAALSNCYYGFPSRKLRLIGVTGTNGKTTTTHLIDAVLSHDARVTGLLGTVCYRVGKESLPVLATTPEASDLQRIFACMVEKKITHVTMEVSSHALQLHRVAGCEFDLAVLTNITGDHLDFHKTFSAYLAAKSKLFSQLRSSSKSDRRRFAVLNSDDQHFQEIAQSSRAQVITYGIEKPADVRGRIVSIDNSGVAFNVESFAGEFFFRLKIRGLFNVYNALAAITVGILEEIPLSQIKESLEAVEGVPGRFETVDAGQDFLLIVDYAHTPDGLENILRSVKEFAHGDIITVFGCGGERDETKRPLMGEVAGEYSNYCVITSDNPRGEDPERIVSQIMPGINSRVSERAYTVILDRCRAIAWAINMAKPHDVVVIAGKGHEDHQVLYDQKIPFNDREVATEIIKRMLKRHKNGMAIRGVE